jgi:hypothetical protein
MAAGPPANASCRSVGFNPLPLVARHCEELCDLSGQQYREDCHMAKQDRLVAIVSPWEKIANLVKHKFRLESLPAEKKVMVWRDDLQNEQALVAELKAIGITAVEISERHITNWKEIE